MELSQWQAHVQKWKGGCGSHVCSSANKVVLAKGKIPCDVLFVGEGPGRSEDVVGRPFVGPAGQLLDLIVERSIPKDVRVAFTNMVCCIPINEHGEVEEPSDDQVESCQERLEELMQIANPKLIVCVGKISQSWLEQGYRHSFKVPTGVKQINITHPAAILRANLAVKGLMVQRSVVTIRTAIEEIF